MKDTAPYSRRNPNASSTYTCNDYREEMILNSLQRRLQRDDLSEEERDRILKELHQLEQKMGL
jgi:hypothetical protein